jgi:hypothetical protein
MQSKSAISARRSVIYVLKSVRILPLDDKAIISAQLVDIDEPPTNGTEELDVKIDCLFL